MFVCISFSYSLNHLSLFHCYLCTDEHIHDVQLLNILPYSWLVKLLGGHYSSVSFLSQCSYRRRRRVTAAPIM